MRSKWGGVLPHSSLVQPNRFFCQQRLSEDLIFLLEWNNSFCLFWTLIIKKKISWKKIIEKNLVSRDLWRSFSPCSTQSWEGQDCKGASFWAHNEPEPRLSPVPGKLCHSSQGAAAAPAAPHQDRLPLPAYPLWLQSVFPVFMKLNAISPIKSFHQSDRGKCLIKMLSKIKWHIIPELLTISIRLLYFQVLS